MDWYKVIVIAVDVFESAIADEKHFCSKCEAYNFIRSLNAGNIGVVVSMGEEK